MLDCTGLGVTIRLLVGSLSFTHRSIDRVTSPYLDEEEEEEEEGTKSALLGYYFNFIITIIILVVCQY